MLTVTIDGGGKAVLELGRLADGAKGLDGYSVLIGTNLIYGGPIETGIRSGRMWRRAGGAFMLRDSLLAEIPRIEKGIVEALPKGGAATRKELLTRGYSVQRGAQSRTPVLTGSLRRSMHTVEGGR